MNTPLARSLHRLVTYSLFAGLAITGLFLEHGLRDLHVSKLILFAAIGVWARELPRAPRRLLLGAVGLLWALVLGIWFISGTSLSYH